MVPVRFVSSELGISNDHIKWDSSAQTATILQGDTKIDITVGLSLLKKNKDGVENRIIMDTQAEITDGRTFIPARYIAEALGARIEWINETKTVEILTDDKVANGNDQQDQSTVERDRFGRDIRTTNLPSNYKDYPYILESISNEMYEMKYPFSHPDPKERKESSELYATVPEFTKENVDIWMERIRNYYDLVLNVDYRTIDENWETEIYEYICKGINEDYLKRTLKEYRDWVQTNQIVIEGWLEPEPTMIYKTGLGGYHVRSNFEFKIVSFKENKNLNGMMELLK